MKIYPFFILSIAAFGLSSCTDEPPLVVDLSTPVISKLDYDFMSEIIPSPGQTIPSDWNSVRFSLQVNDPEGIAEVEFNIKGNFERQQESPYSDNFELLDGTETVNENWTDPRETFMFGAQEKKFDPFSIQWSGIYSVAELPVLAGPYDVIVTATDINGNKTSTLDSTSYQTIIFIDRWYAPVVYRPYGLPEAVTGEAGEELTMEGGILRTEVQDSTPLKFVWIKLVDRDVLGDFKGLTGQTVFEERLWGESLRLDKSGDALPSDSELTFNELFESDPILLPDGQSNLSLVVWTEDEAGNVSRKVFPIAVN